MYKEHTKRFKTIIVLAFFCFIILTVQGCKDKEPIYKAGTYVNHAEGYYSTLLVEVTVSEYEIESITILEHEEPEILSSVVFEKLPPRIMKSNTTDVDVISGATYTSRALLEAVEQALKEAKEHIE